MPLEDLQALGYTVERGAGRGGQHLVYGPEKDEPFSRVWLVEPNNPANEQEVVDQGTNHDAMMTKLAQAQDYFRDNYRDWGTLTAQQKDAANRNAQRALANLIRRARKDMSDAGV